MKHLKNLLMIKWLPLPPNECHKRHTIGHKNWEIASSKYVVQPILCQYLHRCFIQIYK